MDFIRLAAGEELPVLVARVDPGASGQQYTAHLEVWPPLPFELELEQPGRYQLMVRARGQFAAGAWPSICVRVGREDAFRTSASLLGEGWQRLPVGRPIALEAGKVLLSLFCPNPVERWGHGHGHGHGRGRRPALERCPARA